MEETFGEAIRKARESAGLTQSEVASQLNASKGYVSQLETGFRTGITGENLVRLCAALKVPQDHFAKFLAPGVTIPPPPSSTVLEPVDISGFPPVRVVGVVGAGPAIMEPFSNEWVPAFEKYTGLVVAYRIRGTSLEADDIKDGDIVYVQQEPEPQSGDRVIVYVGDLDGHLAKKLKGARPDQRLVYDDGTERYLRNNDKIYGAIVGLFRRPIITARKPKKKGK